MKSKRRRTRKVGPKVRTLHGRRKRRAKGTFWFNNRLGARDKTAMRHRHNLFTFGTGHNNKIQVVNDIPPPPYTFDANEFGNYGVNSQKSGVSQPSKTEVDISRGFMGSTLIDTHLPVAITCPYCCQSVTTKPIAKIGLVTWTACFVLMMLGLFLGCCLIPFCLKDFKDIYHVCPNCKYTIDVIKTM